MATVLPPHSEQLRHAADAASPLPSLASADIGLVEQHVWRAADSALGPQYHHQEPLLAQRRLFPPQTQQQQQQLLLPLPDSARPRPSRQIIHTPPPPDPVALGAPGVTSQELAEGKTGIIAVDSKLDMSHHHLFPAPGGSDGRVASATSLSRAVFLSTSPASTIPSKQEQQQLAYTPGHPETPWSGCIEPRRSRHRRLSQTGCLRDERPPSRPASVVVGFSCADRKNAESGRTSRSVGGDVRGEGAVTGNAKKGERKKTKFVISLSDDEDQEGDGPVSGRRNSRRKGRSVESLDDPEPARPHAAAVVRADPPHSALRARINSAPSSALAFRDVPHATQPVPARPFPMASFVCMPHTVATRTPVDIRRNSSFGSVRAGIYGLATPEQRRAVSAMINAANHHHERYHSARG
ncbi:hypothetical protein BDK51DRAFT_28230, partial [Blyttiomyces helicus]